MVPLCHFGAWKLVFWTSKSLAAREQCHQFFLWLVAAPMAVFPPYNDRSGDDLPIGAGLCPRRCLEC